MVDIDPEKPDKLRFVVFPAPTLASATLIQVSTQTLKAHLFSFKVSWYNNSQIFSHLPLTAHILPSK